MNHRTPGLPVYHQLSEFTQTHVHRVGDAIQPFHPLSPPSPLALNLSQKINKWDLIKLKSFCITKETISKLKRQPSKSEKIIANETTSKRLISKIYKQLIEFNTRKTNNLIKKWGKDLNRHFPKKTYRWLTKGWKDAQHCSLLKKCKSKLQWEITSHQSEWPWSKSIQTKIAGEGVEKREFSWAVGGDVNWFSHCERQYGDSL